MNWIAWQRLLSDLAFAFFIIAAFWYRQEFQGAVLALIGMALMMRLKALF